MINCFQYFNELITSIFRLCLRNLPLSLNADDLKKELVEFSDIEGLSMKDAKIMRSKDRKDESGAFRSMGFGFVDVSCHENALKLLRAVNNNPDIFGENRRPIVEFSVENQKALKILDLKKQKIEQLQTDREQGEKEGMDEQQKEDFDTSKHRSYKEKANEKRLKRRLRYQKKRQEKRAAKDEAGEGSETEATIISPKKQKQQPKKTKTVKSKNDKTPVVTKKGEAEQDAKPRKRPAVSINNNVTSENQESDVSPKKRSRKSKTVSNESEETKFDSLVEQYKKKLNSTTSGKGNKNSERWFNES